VVDTHAHLDACTDPPAALLERARSAGVGTVLTVGTTIESCTRALAAADADDGVFAILGIHPHEAGGPEAERVDELSELLRHPRAVAVGETGLDHFRDYAPRDRQRALFEQHLALAREIEKPVVIHTRAADDATVAALRDHDGDVVLHCFSSPALLPTALERGWYVSFAGNVTYPKAPELREAVLSVPVDRLLIETDCPYLAPQAVRGRENEPAFVVHTLAQLAETRGEHPVGLGEQIERNARAVFRLP